MCSRCSAAARLKKPFFLYYVQNAERSGIKNFPNFRRCWRLAGNITASAACVAELSDYLENLDGIYK